MGQGSSAETDFNTGRGGSSGSAPGVVSGPVKTCYYELLDVSRDATQEDIKKAYKKKALEFHPDRNYNDTERATRLFTEVQAAYEVLSDPQERAWYDSHREAILRNDTGTGSSDNTPRTTNVTTSGDVMEWFSLFASRPSYEDSNPKSFYSVLGKLFAKLAEEEASAAEWENGDIVHYPDFGNSESGHEDCVKNFYTVWSNFRTVKTFSWCDVYRYSDAPDRRVKRIMEKENKRFRDAAIREFNDIVRSFVMFVRKRDPRFISNSQTEAQRQAALLTASKEQAARQRAENAAKLRNYKAADWTKVSEETLGELYDSEELSDEGGSNADDKDEESEDEQVLRYECIVCKKTFGSEGPMNAHERSKKHTKAVHLLKLQMRKENKEFDLDRDVRGWEKKPEEFTPIDDDDEKDLSEQEREEGEGEGEGEEGKVETKEPEAENNTPKPPPSDASGSENNDDDYVTTSQFNARIHGSTPPTSPPSPSSQGASISDLTINSGTETLSKPKLGKAKAKKAKRAATTASTPGDSDTAAVCATCKQSFPSNTKMFSHLKDNPTHTTPIPNGGGGMKKGKGKGKRK